MSIEDMENEYFIGAGYLSIRPTQRPIAFGDTAAFRPLFALRIHGRFSYMT